MTSEPVLIFNWRAEPAQQFLRDVEHDLILWAIEVAENNKVEAARLIQMPYRTFCNKVKKLREEARNYES